MELIAIPRAGVGATETTRAAIALFEFLGSMGIEETSSARSVHVGNIATTNSRRVRNLVPPWRSPQRSFATRVAHHVAAHRNNAVAGLAGSIPETLSRIQSKSGLKTMEVARLLGVSRRTVYNWRDGGGAHVSHEERIRLLDDLLGSLDQTPARVRAALLSNEGGEPLLDSIGRGASIAVIQRALLRQLGEMPVLSQGPAPRGGVRRITRRRDFTQEAFGEEVRSS